MTSRRIADLESTMRNFSDDISDTKRRTWDILSSLSDFAGEGLDEWIDEVSEIQTEVEELENENKELQKRIEELEDHISVLEDLTK
ncbi:hypothetical protein EV294_101338 [Paenibacillus sp. BK033]|uniref:hypothetical protein n=1 Tax=Paenibacillus sp. BK033 TaxID=2512133 RepID=UPI00104AD2E5|nr:hypothetical protein [Paenibacillus sp. BK033]TCN00888.1 hypothetical protein EV294_101338 [Paenibacillus sp. BK033]